MFSLKKNHIKGSGDDKRGLRFYRIAVLRHGWDASTFGAFPRLLKQRGGHLWVEDVLQDMYEILTVGICWGCHMAAVEGDVLELRT